MKRLTVSTLRRCTGSTYQPNYSAVPYLRLSGNWLATQVGLRPGQKVRVRVNGAGLVITPERSAS